MDVLVEITRKIPLGTVLETPSGRSQFIFQHIDSEKVVILIGKKQNRLKIPASLFDDVLDFLKDKGWIRIGAVHEKGTRGTFDQYIQSFTHGTSAASYIAPILEKAGIVDINRDKPAKLRLSSKIETAR